MAKLQDENRAAAETGPPPEPPGDEYREYSGAVRWVILIAVMLGTVLEVLDTSIVNVAIPDMMGNLGATLQQISWVSTGYIIANVIILPLTGWLSSHFGRKRYLAGSMVLFTAASFFCGTSRSLHELVFFRILQGVGGAALLSTAQATLMEVFPPMQIGMVQAIFAIGVLVGPTVGPTLGGWITDNYSWPWIFFINLPVGIAATTLTLMFVHDSKHQKRGSKVDVIGIGLLAVGIGCFQTLLEEGNSEGWYESRLIVWLTVCAVIGLATFVYWELHTDTPAVNLRVLKRPGLAPGITFAAVLGFGLYGGVFILPVFLQNLRHFTAAQTGWILLPGGLTTGLMMPFVGRLVSKYKPRNLTFIGSFGFIASMVVLSRMTIDTSQQQLLLPLMLRGAGMGFLFLPLTLATLSGLRGREVAEATGLFNLSRQVGGSAGIAFLTTFLDHRITFHREMLGEHLSAYNPVTADRLHILASGLVAKGAPLAVARDQALAVMTGALNSQASMLSFEDAFLVMAGVFMCALPLIFLLRNARTGEAHAAPGH
ncbi:MAG TPA: DHA2 family efflux MFS transporter permease subunit [Armatimonadota bacterium]|jgi:DHA2 family multidrug resistance protein